MLLALLISVCVFNSPGTSDVDIWLSRWAPLVDRLGLIPAYTQVHENYPPVGFALVGLVGIVAELLDVSSFVVLKVMLLFFLLASSAITYFMTRSVWGTVVMHLTLTVNSMMHGYLDIFYVPFVLLTFHFVRQNAVLPAVAAFLGAVMMKYQPLIIAPFLLLHVALRSRTDAGQTAMIRLLLSRVLLPIVLFTLCALVVFGPWAIGSVFATTTQHRWLSANALNLNWLVAAFIRPERPLHVFRNDWPVWAFIARTLTVVAYAYALRGYWRSARDTSSLLVWTSVGFLAYYVFNCGVHENHLLLVSVLCTLAVIAEPRRLGFLGYWVIATTINEVLFYGFDGRGFPYSLHVGAVDMTVVFALANVLMFALTVYAARRLPVAAEASGSPPLHGDLATRVVREKGSPAS
jgi:hypothetical protein